MVLNRLSNGYLLFLRYFHFERTGIPASAPAGAVMINRILQTKENIDLDILSDFNDDTVLTFVIESLRHETDSPYSVLLETIFHYSTSEDHAKSLWDSITENRKELSGSSAGR